jgi:fatty acyl-CoA reductase
MVSERISEEMAAIQNAVSSHIGVSEFYGGKTVFITGGTGFMGKVLLEKLLRSCPGVSKIYLLIRPKKGQDAHERLKLLLCSPVSCISFRFPPDPSGGESGFSSDASFFLSLQLFDPIRKSRPTDLHKVLPIEGDITQPELAISPNDRLTLARTVNIVFHSAATIKFDEKLKLSVTINMLGTQRLVELCKRMTNLEALVSR